MTADRRAADATSMRAALGLAPHPEGGWYRETWRDVPDGGGRGAASAILFLLAAGERSAWHRVDAAEIWLWQGGGACALRTKAAACGIAEVVLGPDVAAGQVLQAVVPAGCWQDAAACGADWVLVGCVVAPAFDFAGFEMAPDGWEPRP